MGTGKTAFTRCFVRSFFDDPTMQVTSPTYLLDLHYAAPTRPGIT
jgi:tRNA A37 threonylcarbamoyladenosine biosynthesis protein TsaE